MNQPARSVAPRASWWWLLVPIVLAAALRDMWAPDEPRYAMTARWIYEHDEFLILRRCGELYPDKPPLVYWIAGLCGSLTGWNALAMRLVSILSIAAVAWFTERLARRWMGADEARWAPVLFLGFVLIFWNGARLALDPLLTAGCVGALYFASQPAASEREASRQVLLAGLCAGVGMFAKGPVALVNFGVPLLLWRFAKLHASGPRASRAALAGAVALTVLPVLTWALSACLREPALWGPLFYSQHLGRAAAGTSHHGPPWEPLLQVPLYLLPWSVPVIAGVFAGWRAMRARWRGAEHDEGLLRAWLWFAGLFVVFSVIPAKRELYLLSAYPALALLGARVLVRALRAGRVGRLTALVPVALFTLLGAGFALALPAARWAAPRAAAVADALRDVALGLPEARWAASRSAAVADALRDVLAASAEHPDLAWKRWLVAALFLAGALVALRAFRQRRYADWADHVVFAWSIGLAAALLLFVPFIDGLKSDRATAALLAALPQKPADIPCYGTKPDGVRFYGGGPCSEGALDDLLDGGIERRLDAEGAQFLALVNGKNWERLTAEKRALFAQLARLRVGSRYVLVLGAGPAR